MENYIQHIPYFLGFVLLGVLAKFLKIRKTIKHLTVLRVLDELLNSLFVAVIISAVLDQYFNLHEYFVYSMSSLGGYFSSIILDNTKGLISFLFEKIKSIINKKTN